MITTPEVTPAQRPVDIPARRPQGTTGFTAVRVLFGLIWGIDAVLKWLPGFRSGFAAMVADSGHGQPSWLGPWFRFWTHLIGQAPTLFAVLIALAETAISVALLLGAFQRAVFVFGALFAVMIWGVGEGFGGPYMSGSTDIGCAVIYSVVFLALGVAVPRAVRAAAPGLDQRLARIPALRWTTFR